MDRNFSEDSRLVYMTTGVLLQMMINRKNFDDWTHIVIGMKVVYLVKSF